MWQCASSGPPLVAIDERALVGRAPPQGDVEEFDLHIALRGVLASRSCAHPTSLSYVSEMLIMYVWEKDMSMMNSAPARGFRPPPVAFDEQQTCSSVELLHKAACPYSSALGPLSQAPASGSQGLLPSTRRKRADNMVTR